MFLAVQKCLLTSDYSVFLRSKSLATAFFNENIWSKQKIIVLLLHRKMRAKENDKNNLLR